MCEAEEKRQKAWPELQWYPGFALHMCFVPCFVHAANRSIQFPSNGVVTGNNSYSSWSGLIVKLARFFGAANPPVNRK